MDKKKKNRQLMTIVFAVTLFLIACLFFLSLILRDSYNKKVHQSSFEGEKLFTSMDDSETDVSVRIEPRSSTWSKCIDYYDEGLYDANYQAYTYDIYIRNNLKDEIADYTFKFVFDREVYLLSAWNGSLEIHQQINNKEYEATVPDLREFTPNDYSFDTVTTDGETLIRMKKDDYLIYYPSTSENSLEKPIGAYEGIVSGIIIYVPIEEDLSGSTLEFNYTFHRMLWSEPLFRIATVCMGVWLLSLLIFCITEVQYKKYKRIHEHDLDMIMESIETFTGFIDAKDPYTNGHSNRVAQYTKLIAQSMGFEGEELDRIYYVALLHDCGKIGVPDNILGKPGRLTDEEFDIIKSHTTRGSEILSHFKSLPDADEGARYHHERYDGKGYPEGLKGEDIPLIGRMICVADSYDAMNSNRVYRKKLTKEDIIKEIENNKGTQFDPKIADVFLKFIKNGLV
ncbi:MAG: HD-GYP domain-containing protein [Clostridiales bacterium]|nr:HD-GYP domain-containing protein [Clostridiales bacterium]